MVGGYHRDLHSSPTRRSSDLSAAPRPWKTSARASTNSTPAGSKAVAQALLPAASPLLGTLLVRHRVPPANRVETSLDTAGTSACATSADGLVECALDLELGAHHFVIQRMLQRETELFADAHNSAVVGQNVGGQLGQFLVRAHDQQPRQQFFAQAAALPLVANQYRYFGFRGAVNLHHPAHAQDVAFAGFGVVVLRHQRHFTVVIDEADPGQPFVLGPLFQIHQVEVAQVHGALAERLVEAYQGRFVFGTDGPDGYGVAVLHGPAHGGARQIGRASCRERG